MPQFGQNFPLGTAVPHFGQARGAGAGAPQLGQNFALADIVALHLAQVIVGPAGAGAVEAPQDGQNRLPAGISVPHLGQGLPCAWACMLPCIAPVIP